MIDVPREIELLEQLAEELQRHAEQQKERLNHWQLQTGVRRLIFDSFVYVTGMWARDFRLVLDWVRYNKPDMVGVLNEIYNRMSQFLSELKLTHQPSFLPQKPTSPP